MSYSVRIRKNATGEIRTFSCEEEWDDPSEEGSGTIWLWTEGNFGCDCNRHLFFEEAGGNTDDGTEVECSEGLYTVIDATLPDGRVIEIDDK